MPAAYRSASANGGAGNIVVNRPTGVVNNDVLLAFVRPGFQNTVTAPAGWTQFRNDTLSANHSFQAYWKAANNEPASESWTNVSGSNGSVIVIATSGVHTTNPLHQNVFSTTAVDGSNIDAPSVVTTIDGCLILRIGTEWGNGGWPLSHTWASGATKILDQQFQSTAYDNALVSPAGASGTRRLTWAQFVGATSQGALTLALAPASTDVAVAGSDPATQSEAANVVSTVSFSGVDTLAITDTVANTQVLLSVVTDAWSLTEVVNAVGETASKSGSDALTLSEETSAVSSAVAAVDTAVQSELAALANTLSSAESVALTDTANVLRTLYVTGSDSATQAEALALAHYLTSSDALVHSESAAVGEFEFRAVFDSLVMIGEQAIQSEIFVSPAITLPTRAVVELWAATVLIGASQTEAGVADPATDAALDDMLTLVNLLTTE